MKNNLKSAVAFFFLFFLHGTSIGIRQQGISYNGTRLVVRRGIRTTKLSIMIRRLLEALHLIKPQKPRLQQTDVSGSASRKVNPYQLIWYKQGWSKTRTEKNNAKYWQFEIEHNGLRLP